MLLNYSSFGDPEKAMCNRKWFREKVMELYAHKRLNRTIRVVCGKKKRFNRKSAKKARRAQRELIAPLSASNSAAFVPSLCFCGKKIMESL